MCVVLTLPSTAIFFPRYSETLHGLMAGLRSESRSLMPMPLLLTGAVEAELLRVYLEKKKGDGAPRALRRLLAGAALGSKLFFLEGSFA